MKPLTMNDLRAATLPFMSRVIESQWLPDGQVYIFNEQRERTPDGWDQMSSAEKLRWAIDHGCAVVVGRKAA